MARPLRIEHPGAAYHILMRGAHQEPIYQDDADGVRIQECLAEAPRSARSQMGDLKCQLGRQGAYTGRFKVRPFCGWSGSLGASCIGRDEALGGARFKELCRE